MIEFGHPEIPNDVYRAWVQLMKACLKHDDNNRTNRGALRVKRKYAILPVKTDLGWVAFRHVFIIQRRQDGIFLGEYWDDNIEFFPNGFDYKTFKYFGDACFYREQHQFRGSSMAME